MRHFGSNLCWEIEFNSLIYRNFQLQLMLSLTKAPENFRGLFHVAAVDRKNRSNLKYSGTIKPEQRGNRLGISDAAIPDCLPGIGRR